MGERAVSPELQPGSTSPRSFSSSAAVEEDVMFLQSVPESMLEHELMSLLKERKRVAPAQLSDRPTPASPLSEPPIPPPLPLGGQAARRSSPRSTLSELRADQVQLETLRSQLDTSERVAQSVGSIFGRFDVRLTELEGALKPLHERTNRLKLVHHNVDAAMAALQTVLGVFNTAHEVEARIKDGPRGAPDKYIAAMDRLEDAMNYLRDHDNYKSAGKVLKHLEALQDIALREAEAALKDGIAKYGGPVNVDALVAILASESLSGEGGVDGLDEPIGASGGGRGGQRTASQRTSDEAAAGTPSTPSGTAGGGGTASSFVLIDSRRVDELRQWICRLAGRERVAERYEAEYARVRGKRDRDALHRLFRDQRYGKDAKFADLLRTYLRLLEEEKKMCQRLFGTAPGRSAPGGVVGSAATGQAAVTSDGQLNVPGKTGVDKDSTDDGLAADGSPTRWAAVFSQVLVPSLTLFIESAESKIKQAKTLAASEAKSAGGSGGGKLMQFSPALFVILDVWRAFGPASPALASRLTQFAAMGPGKFKQPLAHFMEEVRDEAQKALNEFEAAVVKHPVKGPLPPDGTVHALASNTLNFLKRLHLLRDVLITVLPDPSGEAGTLAAATSKRAGKSAAGGGTGRARRNSVSVNNGRNRVSIRFNDSSDSSDGETVDLEPKKSPLSTKNPFAEESAKADAGDEDTGDARPVSSRRKGAGRKKSSGSKEKSGSESNKKSKKGKSGKSKHRGRKAGGASSPRSKKGGKKAADGRFSAQLAGTSGGGDHGVGQNSDTDSEEDSSRRVLGTFYVRIVELLRENLEAKARKKEKRGDTLATVFLLNNYNYILRVVKGSVLLKSVVAVHPRFKREFEELVEAQMAVYRDAWQRAVDALLSKDLPPPSNSYTKKERGVVKAKFDQFNKEVDELSSAHRSYAIPDTKLRKKVRALTKANVLPEYQRFYQAYAGTPFTANYAKYVKFTPEELETQLNNYFEGGVGRHQRYLTATTASRAASAVAALGGSAAAIPLSSIPLSTDSTSQPSTPSTPVRGAADTRLSVAPLIQDTSSLRSSSTGQPTTTAGGRSAASHKKKSLWAGFSKRLLNK